MPRRKIPQEVIEAAHAASEFQPSASEPSKRLEGKKGLSRIMYIERKAGELIGEARIGRVTFSKSGKSIYYSGKQFKSLKGSGFKSNYFEIESGDDYWISGPKKDGADRLYGERLPIDIDEEVREEYWTRIRNQPDRINDAKA
ncbi:hypothetical protein [Puniceicoccus vermicola]|nr:hypothetical protein [Puniceicoccus vermicola]